MFPPRDFSESEGRGNRRPDVECERFASLYLANNGNLRDTGIEYGLKPKWARQNAYRILQEPRVQAYIEKVRRERLEEARMSADDIIRGFEDIALADIRDIVQMRRCCCRYCWGKDFKYQFTPYELSKARNEFAAKTADIPEGKRPKFDNQGGLGFEKYADPNPECPECAGLGVERVFIEDVRDLPASASALIASIRQTRDGIEVKLHSRPEAFVNLARCHGLFKDEVALRGNLNIRNEEMTEEAMIVAADVIKRKRAEQPK